MTVDSDLCRSTGVPVKIPPISRSNGFFRKARHLLQRQHCGSIMMPGEASNDCTVICGSCDTLTTKTWAGSALVVVFWSYLKSWSRTQGRGAAPPAPAAAAAAKEPRRRPRRVPPGPIPSPGRRRRRRRRPTNGAPRCPSRRAPFSDLGDARGLIALDFARR